MNVKRPIFRRINSLSSETRKVLLLSTIFFSITLIFAQIYPTYSDASRHLISSRWIVSHGWLPYDEYAFDLAKYYVTPPGIHILSAMSKISTGTYYLIPAASGSISIVLTYLLVSLWYDRSLGLATAIVLAVNPFFILWSSRLYVGTTITAGFLLTTYLYFKYIKYNKKWYIYLAFICGGSLSAVKTYGPIAAGIILFHLLWIQRDQLIKTLRNVSGPLTAGVFASFPWPIRNFILTGSPVPKATGNPALEAASSVSGRDGIHVLIPELEEFALFFVRALGVWPPRAVTEYLGYIHPTLPIVWFVLPGVILLTMIYGFKKTSVDPIVYIWILSFIILYFIQRVASGGLVGFKYRHFVTITPIFCMLFIIGYQKISFSPRIKKIVGILLVTALLVQMSALAAFQTEKMQTTFEPASDWIEENIQHDDVIYMPYFQEELSHRVHERYKFISASGKEGYISQSDNFTEAIQDRADWVISYEEADKIEKERINNAVAANKIELVETIKIKETIQISNFTVETATFDRTWYIYKVTDD
jgi:4-amino-4-deoxy-L-arabinose transferase-like glycosyltransferase